MYPALIPLFKQLITVLGSISLILAGQPKYGAINYNPTGGGTYRLQSSIGLSDTSITLSSFKEPISNIKYTMSYLNSSIEFGTLEPANATKKEFISFSGITQNGDGTATLTGVIRGLSFSYPYTASTTLQQSHSGQSIFILSNPPQLTNQYANKTNSETINPCGSSCGTWTFASTSPPVYDVHPTFLNNLQIIDKQYADGLAIAGAPAGNFNTAGIYKEASGLDMASSTVSRGGYDLALTSQFATSTPGVNATTTVVVTQTNGKIHPSFLNGTDSYRFNGDIQTASTTAQGNFITGTLVATSSTASFNGVTYTMPSVLGASSTVLTTNSTGGLSFIQDPFSLLNSTTTSTLQPYATTTFTTSNRNLHFVAYAPSQNTVTSYKIRFNGDNVSTNYATTFGVDNQILTKTNGGITFTAATNTQIYIVGDVSNITANKKLVTWRGVTQDAGGTPASLLTLYGSGVWNNTSSNITNMTFYTGDESAGALGIGSYLKVYSLGD